MGIDLLREHLGTLTVQSRRKRLTRNVTPHPCIVAHARSARKDLAKTELKTPWTGAAACEDPSMRRRCPVRAGGARPRLVLPAKLASRILAVILVAGVAACSHPPAPQPPIAKSRTAIALPQAPAEITYSGGSNKLYVAYVFPSNGWLVVPLSAPTPAHEFPDRAIAHAHHIVVDNKLKLGYALGVSGAITVFNTDSDTTVATTQPVCEANVLAVDERTGTVYGGGFSSRGECLLQMDSSAHIVRDDVGGGTGSGHNIIQRIAVDPTNGDVIYSDPSGITRVDASLKEKWSTPVGKDFEPLDIGLEPHTNRIYVSLTGPNKVALPATPPPSFRVYDGQNGKRVGTVAGSPWEFVADNAGHVFTALSTPSSRDLYVLTDGGTTPSKFASLGDIPGLKPSDLVFLQIDPSGQRLFVAAGDLKNVYVYAY
jgi:hypothetical protein